MPKLASKISVVVRFLEFIAFGFIGFGAFAMISGSQTHKAIGAGSLCLGLILAINREKE